jgi:hypothetical protein
VDHGAVAWPGEIDLAPDAIDLPPESVHSSIRQLTSDPLPFFVPTETGIFGGQGPPEPGFRA